MDKHIAVLDTSISSLNVGNDIIMDAVMAQVQAVFPDSQHIRVPANDKIWLTTLSILRRSRVSIYGGTNALNSRMNRNRKWKFDSLDAYFVKHKVVLLGVGWLRYEQQTNFYTRLFLGRVLSHEGLHSVRDAYTEQKLRAIGINNVVNTGCPTMWGLTRAHCDSIPRTKTDRVIFTLTDYNQQPDVDKRMIEILKKNYSELSFWVQGNKDYQYFQSLGSITDSIRVIPANLPAYNGELMQGNTDYVGTRLHAGIRALQLKIRSIIIGIDNRAEEKRKSFDLPVLDRKDMNDLDRMIQAPLELNIKLPLANIELWKNQFNA